MKREPDRKGEVWWSACSYFSRKGHWQVDVMALEEEVKRARDMLRAAAIGQRRGNLSH